MYVNNIIIMENILIIQFTRLMMVSDYDGFETHSVDISFKNLSYMDLSNIRFYCANLTCVDLSGVNFHVVNLYD